MTGFDFKRLDNEITLGINYIYRYYTPTALIFNDRKFYYDNEEALTKLDCIRIGNRKYFGTNNKKVIGVRMKDTGFLLPIDFSQGLKTGLYKTNLTGLTALSLAIALGFKEIYLLGYDCGFNFNPKIKLKRQDGHFFSKDFKTYGDTKSAARELNNAVKDFDVYRDVPGIFDCSINGALRQFPKVRISQVLEAPAIKLNRDEQTNRLLDKWVAQTTKAIW